MNADFSEGRVGIRRYRPEDVPLVFAAARESVTELSRWMPWCRENYSEEDSKGFVLTREAMWYKGEEYDFAIYDVETGVYLGGVGLNSINGKDHVANLGYWVRTGRTRQGVAPVAARLIARFGFEEAKLRRLEIVAAVDNKPSQRVAEKTGATREGIMRNRLTLHEKQSDAVIYSLIPSDLRR